MEYKPKHIVPLLLPAAGTLAAALLPLEALTALGGWLRALSLSGGVGNALAWALVLGLSALPALGLLWRPGSRWDWPLALAAAVGCLAFVPLLLLLPVTAAILVSLPMERVFRRYQGG